MTCYLIREHAFPKFNRAMQASPVKVMVMDGCVACSRKKGGLWLLILPAFLSEINIFFQREDLGDSYKTVCYGDGLGWNGRN